MIESPLHLYAEALRAAGDVSMLARRLDGSTRAALVQRWRGTADETDERVLGLLDGPVLDVGCGPGRHLHALHRRGVAGLGVDLSPVAVGLARGRGVPAIVASIFDELSLPGGWAGALLLDGNIGIGGRPDRLLRRVASLLAPGGRLLVELEGPEHPTVHTTIRLESAGAVSDWFPWAELSVSDVDRCAADAGLGIVRHLHDGDRWFALLSIPEGGPANQPPSA